MFYRKPKSSYKLPATKPPLMRDVGRRGAFERDVRGEERGRITLLPNVWDVSPDGPAAGSPVYYARSDQRVYFQADNTTAAWTTFAGGGDVEATAYINWSMPIDYIDGTPLRFVFYVANTSAASTNTLPVFVFQLYRSDGSALTEIGTTETNWKSVNMKLAWESATLKWYHGQDTTHPTLTNAYEMSYNGSGISRKDSITLYMMLDYDASYAAAEKSDTEFRQLEIEYQSRGVR